MVVVGIWINKNSWARKKYVPLSEAMKADIKAHFLLAILACSAIAQSGMAMPQGSLPVTQQSLPSPCLVGLFLALLWTMAPKHKKGNKPHCPLQTKDDWFLTPAPCAPASASSKSILWWLLLSGMFVGGAVHSLTVLGSCIGGGVLSWGWFVVMMLPAGEPRCKALCWGEGKDAQGNLQGTVRHLQEQCLARYSRHPVGRPPSVARWRGHCGILRAVLVFCHCQWTFVYQMHT